jgi:hypothetical protein
MLETITATIYTGYKATIVDDEGIEQENACLAGLWGAKLVLKFKSVNEFSLLLLLVTPTE